MNWKIRPVRTKQTQEPSNIKQRRNIDKTLFIYTKSLQVRLEAC